MSEKESSKSKVQDSGLRAEELPVLEGELVEISPVEIEFQDEEPTVVSARTKLTKQENPKPKTKDQKPNSQPALRNYLLLPWIFLTVTLFGGLRLSDPANNFLFVRPALICLIFASILILLFFRARLIVLEGWFSEDFATLKNIANGAVLLTLFTASVQVFNALLPERGLPFWVVAFCFFWTLWNNLFSEFETKKLLKSLGALFGLAFVVKYLLLANLTAPNSESWWQGILQNPTKEALTWALDLPRFAAGTGYIQFFTLAFYLIGLYLFPKSSQQKLKD